MKNLLLVTLSLITFAHVAQAAQPRKPAPTPAPGPIARCLKEIDIADLQELVNVYDDTLIRRLNNDASLIGDVCIFDRTLSVDEKILFLGNHNGGVGSLKDDVEKYSEFAKCLKLLAGNLRAAP